LISLPHAALFSVIDFTLPLLKTIVLESLQIVCALLCVIVKRLPETSLKPTTPKYSSDQVLYYRLIFRCGAQPLKKLAGLVNLTPKVGDPFPVSPPGGFRYVIRQL
jgi:hypothetical protein